jgi:hypothetical protein
MIKIIKSTLLIFMFLLTFIPSLFAIDYYVAKSGNDLNDGSLTTPFLTIQKASNVAVSGDVVNVMAGIYREQVIMKSNGVTFQSYQNDVVTINGNDLVTNWTLESGNTYKSTITTNLDSRFGSNQMFSDGKMIELVRWPNQTSTDIVKPTNAIASGATASGNIVTLLDNNFNEPTGRWVGAKIWLNLSRKNADGQGRTYTVISTAPGSITFDYGQTPVLTDAPWGVGDQTEYFLFNPTSAGVAASGGIDAVLDNGEWWKDGTTVYVKSPDGTAPSSTGLGTNTIEFKTRQFAFYTRGTNAQKSNLTIRNFNLFGCAIATTDQLNSGITQVQPASAREVTYELSHDNLIENINAKYVSHLVDMSGDYQAQHIGWTGFILAGRNNTMLNCKIQYSATSAISIQGYTNKVLNCEVSDVNYFCSNAGAINNGYVSFDTEIANCKIYNTTIMGIYIRSWKNSNLNIPGVARIHHNEIYNCMRRSGDSGAIDGASVDGQYARIDHNTLYNTLTDAMTGTDKCGIYLDFGGFDNGGGGLIGRFILDHNVIYKITLPILLNKLQDLLVYNNTALSLIPGKNSIGDASGGSGASNIKLYNNICNAPFGFTMYFSDQKNNITNAEGTVLDDLFINAAAGDYHLKSTATAAINMGTNLVAPYNPEVTDGFTDIGAYEYGVTTPVTILNFSAKADNNKSKLEWTTISEINNAYFKVEKSLDGINFLPLTKVDGNGTSQELHKYFTYDSNPSNGTNYYRLTQVDKNGTSNIIGIKGVSFNLTDTEITVYPNPTSDVVYVNLKNYIGNTVNAKIIDMSGKTIYTESIAIQNGKNVYQLQIKNKPLPGMYILNLSGSGISKSMKVSFNK